MTPVPGTRFLLRPTLAEILGEAAEHHALPPDESDLGGDRRAFLDERDAMLVWPSSYSIVAEDPDRGRLAHPVPEPARDLDGLLRKRPRAE